MWHRRDKRANETWREIVARRHRRQRRVRRLVTLLALLLGVVAALSGWIAYVMVLPPRPRVSQSQRLTLGLFVENTAEGGVRVLASAPPARLAGLHPGDRIVSVDGEAIEESEDLSRALRRAGRGAVLRIEARRPEGGRAGETYVLVNVAPELRPLSPRDLGLPYEDAAWSGPAGTLRGWFVPPPDPSVAVPAVVYAHGNASDRTQWLELAWYIHHAGFAQLLFDSSGRGESDGWGVTLGLREAEDVRAALAWLAGRPEVDSTRLAAVGHSMGAAAVLLAVAEGAPARALVLDSAFADLPQLVADALRAHFLPAWPFRPLAFGLVRLLTGYDPWENRPVEAIPRVAVPVLLIHGTADEIVPLAHAEALAAAARGPVEFMRLEGLAHNDTRPPEVREAILAFLRRHLGVRAGAP